MNYYFECRDLIFMHSSPFTRKLKKRKRGEDARCNQSTSSGMPENKVSLVKPVRLKCTSSYLQYIKKERNISSMLYCERSAQ